MNMIVPNGAVENFEVVPLTSKVRKAVFEAWKGTCAYCDDREATQVDHIFPRAKGGVDALENYAGACETCNRKKTDLILGEGILHIIQAQAKQKAPRIRGRIDATTLKRPSRKETRELLFEDIVSAFEETGMCPTAARLRARMDVPNLPMADPGKLRRIARKRRNGDNTFTCLIELKLPPDVRREMVSLDWQTSGDMFAEFTPGEAPKLEAWLRDRGSWPFAQLGQNRQANLLHSFLLGRDVRRVTVNVMMPKLLRRAEELGAQVFSYRSYFSCYGVPSAAQCMVVEADGDRA